MNSLLEPLAWMLFRLRAALDEGPPGRPPLWLRIAAARTLHAELGGTKGPVPEEQVTMDFAFATVVTIAPIREGEVLTRENLWVKRPGTGSIPAEHYESLLGRVARRDLPADTHLQHGDYR